MTATSLLTSGTVNVTAGQSYQVSAYGRGQLDPDDSAGSVWLGVRFFNSSGALVGTATAKAISLSEVDGTWKQFTGVVTAPAGAISLYVDLESYYNAGWVTFDDVDVRTAPVVTKYYDFNGQRIAMRKDGVLYYLHPDHLGSVTMVTRADGTVEADQRYFAYGQQRTGMGLPTDDNFTGQKLDSTGLVYMNARYYDPQLGQFISPDTLVPDATNVMDYNRYAYARGNPMKYNDPTGHCGTAVVSGGSTAALDLTCWEIVGEAASETAAPAAAAAATVAVVGGGYIAAQWAMQDNGPAVPPLYPTLGQNVGDGNISVTIPVPSSTTVTSGVPLTSDNQTSIAGVTPVNQPAQQLVEPLPQKRTASDSIVSAHFPDAKQLAKRLGVSEGEFHKEIKSALKADFSKELSKAGIKNPDIGFNDEGNIVFKDPRTGKIIETDVPLDSYRAE